MLCNTLSPRRSTCSTQIRQTRFSTHMIPETMERTVFDGEIYAMESTKWAHLRPEDKPTTLQHTLCCINKELYPNVIWPSSPSLWRCPCRQQPLSVLLVLYGGYKTYLPSTMWPDQRGCLVSLSCMLTEIGPWTPTKSSRSFVPRSCVDWHSNFEHL